MDRVSEEQGHYHTSSGQSLAQQTRIRAAFGSVSWREVWWELSVAAEVGLPTAALGVQVRAPPSFLQVSYPPGEAGGGLGGQFREPGQLELLAKDHLAEQTPQPGGMGLVSGWPSERG